MLRQKRIFSQMAQPIKRCGTVKINIVNTVRRTIDVPSLKPKKSICEGNWWVN